MSDFVLLHVILMYLTNPVSSNPAQVRYTQYNIMR